MLSSFFMKVIGERLLSPPPPPLGTQVIQYFYIWCDMSFWSFYEISSIPTYKLFYISLYFYLVCWGLLRHRAVSCHSSRHPQEILLTQFSLCVPKRCHKSPFLHSQVEILKKCCMSPSTWADALIKPETTFHHLTPETPVMTSRDQLRSISFESVNSIPCSGQKRTDEALSLLKPFFFNRMENFLVQSSSGDIT